MILVELLRKVYAMVVLTATHSHWASDPIATSSILSPVLVLLSIAEGDTGL
jgi:hypothetical protein